MRRLANVPSLSWDDCRLLVESVADYAIFMLDAEGHIATWNLGAERIKGYRAEEIIGEHFSKFYPPEDVAAGKCERELADATRDGRVEDEGWRVRKDGSRFWASVVITALRDGDGKLRGFAKVTRDLTRRREAEEELRRAEERFRLLIESVTDHAIYMLDPHGVVTTWNVGAERIKGYKASEIIGESFSRFFLPEDAAAGKPAKELELALALGRFEDEGWRVRKDGKRFWATVVVTPLHNAQGQHIGFSKVTRDLSARREAEKTQAQLALAETAVTKAEEANRLKDEFLATVSHELRTPLTAMIGWARLLRLQPLEPKVAAGIEVIERNAGAQAKIIEDLLDISRIVSGKLRLTLTPIDLVALTNEALEVVRPSAVAKDIDIDFDAREVGTLVGDGERLRQVVWNLVSNSVKFTPPHGKVRLTLEQTGPSVVLTVSDTGKGISQDFMPYVFERFKQADQTITRTTGGLGLGLALVRHIVEQHGGTVTAASAGENRGSTFTVTIPVRAVLPSQPPDSQSPPPPLVDSLQGLRVLVVDDEHDARELVAAILSGAGANVSTAASAQQAFECYQRVHPQLIVSDLGMPIEDGYSLIRRVRALGGDDRRVPAVALSAYTRSEDRARAFAAGFTTHMAKPVDPDDLVRTVTSLVDLARR